MSVVVCTPIYLGLYLRQQNFRGRKLGNKMNYGCMQCTVGTLQNPGDYSSPLDTMVAVNKGDHHAFLTAFLGIVSL